MVLILCAPGKGDNGSLREVAGTPQRRRCRERWESGGVTESTSAARRAVLHTNQGDITVELFPDHAPKTVANFADLAEGRREWTHPATREKTTARLYDGTVFHRIIDGFMIQGGDPLGQGIGGPGYQFGDEIHPDLAFTKPYLLAMANAGPGTNGSQFFITVAATSWLTGKHTIFGEVADQESRDVVDRIAKVATGRGDKPVEDVVIQSVEVQRS
jgi:peptidyl-prolyl cis-trans isomerase A (cyclophilin A)